MNKRKLMSSLFAGAMTLGMILSVSPVFAAPSQTGTTYDNPAELWLAKEVDIEKGTTFEQKTFSFDFTQTGYNNSANFENYTVDLDTTLSLSNQNNELDTNPITSVNVLKDKEFPAAGIYTYTVAEIQGEDEAQENQYGWTYSDATYTVKVYVKNSDEGTYVSNVIVNKTVNDNGTPNNDDNDGKVDPNPGNGDNSGFRFVNTYTKKAEGTTDPDDGEKKLAMYISKDVSGDYADKTLGFKFNVTIKLPDTAPKTSYTGKVGDVSYTFEDNDSKEVTLSHGQKLKFEDLPVGTTYTVTESGTANYIPSVNIVENGKEETDSAQKGEPLTVESKKIGEGSNSAAFTNTYDDKSIITPTGIIINNLPFVLMVAIAGSGLALYVVSKRRTHQ